MSVIDGETIRFVGGYYERKGSEITKYYMAGAARVAMRKYTIPQSMTVEYILGDHLGSTSITTDSNGAMVSELRYKPWGELRYTWTDASASTSPAYELTRYQYTGQYSYDVEFGLKYYGARFYDSAVGRFVSADTVIPGGTQGYDRYAYANNNPCLFVDPSGHEGIPWSLSGSSSSFATIINGVGSLFGAQNLSQTMASAADAVALACDVAALAVDAAITGLEATAFAIGMTGGTVVSPGTAPVTGEIGGFLGAGIVHAATMPALQTANLLAATSTLLTYESDLLTGESTLDWTLSGDATSAHFSMSGTLGVDTYTSAALTGAGFLAPVAPISLPLQGAAVANDLGYLRDYNVGYNLVTSGNYLGLGIMALSQLPEEIPFSVEADLWE